MQIALINILRVGNFAVVQLHQQALLPHPGHHVVRGDDDIVAVAAALYSGVEHFVGGEGLVIDVDARLRLKIVKDRLVDILAPVVYIDAVVGLPLLAACQRQSQEQGQEQNGEFLHHWAPPFTPSFWRTLFRFSACLVWCISRKFTMSSRASTVTNRMVDRALTSGLMRLRVMA